MAQSDRAQSDPPYERLGAKVLSLPDVIAQSVGFMGPVFSAAFVIPLVVGVISASGKGGGVASPLSVLIAAIGWIVSSYAKEVHAAGGGTGIGAAVTRLLTAGGDEVAIFGRRAGPLRAVALQTGAVDIVCDVSDAGQVASCVAGVVERFGRLDGLVLNAGIMLPGGVAELSARSWDTLVAVNLTGAFHVAKAALPHLLRQRGAVVAVASVAALRASNQMGGYAVTKAGLAMLTQSLAVDHAHQGLRANVVCPGWTITEMGDEEMADFGASRGVSVGEAYELVTALVPQRRAASAAEVAAVVGWLLSDAASYVNGAVIPVDGAGLAVDVGTVPYDPRVQIRRES